MILNFILKWPDYLDFLHEKSTPFHRLKEYSRFLKFLHFRHLQMFHFFQPLCTLSLENLLFVLLFLPLDVALLFMLSLVLPGVALSFMLLDVALSYSTENINIFSFINKMFSIVNRNLYFYLCFPHSTSTALIVSKLVLNRRRR